MRCLELIYSNYICKYFATSNNIGFQSKKDQLASKYFSQLNWSDFINTLRKNN